MTQASNRGAIGRVALTANVEELAAALFLRHCAEVMERVALQYAVVGTPGSTEAARQVRQSLAEMREIDRLRNLARAQVGSDSGTPEPLASSGAALLSQPPGSRLTVEQVAERTKKSTGYIRRLCRTQVLSAIQPGRAFLIDEESVEDYEARRRI